MRHLGRIARARLLIGASAAAIVCSSGAALAQDKAPITIAPQPLASALYEFGGKTGTQVIFPSSLATAKRSAEVVGASDEGVALTQLLAGTGLTFQRKGDVFVILAQEGGSDPQSGSAAGEGAEVEALVVTAQKREEDIQDVPIAISAFTQKDLEAQKIEGGFDLLKAIPNVTFSKSNFSSYNFSIRGVGTKAISATTDPGVAVAFNNNTLIQNRLFEQEYFDIERVEVLRGPQGTLYGRNATSGVINVITAKPDLNEFNGSIKGEVGNYDTRRAVGMVNIPLVEDKLAVRLAGSWTQRSGYDYNSVTQNAVNGRDLWSARITVGFEPTDRIRGNLIWEHFEEDDDRSRTGKQLCHRDPGPTHIGATPISGVHPEDIARAERSDLVRPALFSQSCRAGSLYDKAALGTPNGLSLPFIFGAHVVADLFPVGFDPVADQSVGILDLRDPYGGMMQSPDLRTIASINDPRYRAKSDLLELSFDVDLTDALTFTSQTVYNKDEVYSFQDYNRFNTQPIFTDTSALLADRNSTEPSPYASVAPRPEGSPLGAAGVFCDPQLGCSDTIAGFDISQAKGRQFSQEFRLQSDFDGPVNFSMGVNYTRFQTLIDYYVFYNIITALAIVPPLGRLLPDPNICDLPAYPNGTPIPPEGVDINHPNAGCIYIDPNPIESIDGEGHNYFRSKNPYKLRSVGAFGELYWNIAEDLKLTAGLRYTDDIKTFTPVPSQVLLANGINAGGTVNKGYPEKPDIEQQWGEFTGRLGLDWKPVLPFTDETLVYGSYSRGYKGGGANPPSPGFATGEDIINLLRAANAPITGGGGAGSGPVGTIRLTAVEYGRTFDPEFVNAFEVGSKNTLLEGRMTLNAGAFYYDYKDYQVSQIRDRTAVNENFDATIWGLEFETTFAPTRDLKINANLGYLDTEIADGETSIDIMNRTQGDPNYVLVKSWPQLPSNCVVPLHIAEWQIQTHPLFARYMELCGGVVNLLNPVDNRPVDTLLGGRYDEANYPELNGGAGIKAQLGGNELPNAPHWTTNVGVQYGFDLPGGWRTTVRGDAYWQSQSWARVYNAVNDKLHGWYNVNLSLWAEHEDLGLKVELYAKNLVDDTPITDAFLNSDDSGLTTNVFVLDPRIVGLSIRKNF